MSHRKGNTVFLEPTPPAKCDDCGEERELRPYGPNGTNICHACGMKDPDGTRRRMAILLFGEQPQ